MKTKIKTSELAGDPLRWAVAMCLGWAWKADDKGKIILARPYPEGLKKKVNATGMKTLALKRFLPTDNWSVAGPIIEREGINLSSVAGITWCADGPVRVGFYGPTPLVAAMRCYVASKLGNEVEIPEELTESKS